MKDDPDREPIERFRKGDSGAFDDLVKRHQPQIRRLVFRYVKSEEDAEDIAQRAFVRAFEKLDTFRSDASFQTWLYRIAINLALNHLRSTPPVDPLPIEDVAAFTNSLATSKLVAADVWRKVGARLGQLPPMQRLAVELRAFHDLSFKEIAAVADSSEDAAKAAFHHGLKSLKGILSG